MFEKSCEDWDFLWIRLGTGSIVPNISVEFQKREDFLEYDVLWEEAQKMIERQSKIEDAPVVFKLPFAETAEL